jgi:nicotinate-nucleotide adenylyltransferase
MTERLGVFGGTFDPIHHGHLIIAAELKFKLGLDRVLFLPAGRPPHKTDREVTSDSHRLDMLESVLSGESWFDVSYIDIENSGLSYTADSMRLHKARYPEAEIHFLMGQDSLRDLPYWHEPERITEQVRLGVAMRPGVVVDLDYIFERVPAAEGTIDFVNVPLIQIASSDIRRRVRDGQPIRYHVPPVVEAYIEQHGLYRPKGKK